MKKVLAMCLVLSMATLANAAVLEVVTYDIGQSGGRTGSSYDPLTYSDVIGVAVVVGLNPYPGYPGGTYDGYLVSSVDIDLHAVGPASLSVDTLKTGDPKVYTDLDSLVVDDPVGGNMPRMQGISLSGLGAGGYIVDWIFLHCDGRGLVTLDLTLLGKSEYAPFNDGAGGPYPAWQDMVEGDLGDLDIHQIPEPVTVVLLGLGSLALLRRRRR
jgi:hypothetical protein